MPGLRLSVLSRLVALVLVFAVAIAHGVSAQDATPETSGGLSAQSVSVYGVQWGCDGNGQFSFIVTESFSVIIAVVDANSGDFLAVSGPTTYGQNADGGQGFGSVPFSFPIPWGHEDTYILIQYPGVEPAKSDVISCPSWNPTPVPPTPTPVPTFVVDDLQLSCSGAVSFDYDFTGPQQIVIEMYDEESGQVFNASEEVILGPGSGTYAYQFPAFTGYHAVTMIVARGPGLSEDTISNTIDCIPPTPTDGIVSLSTTCAGLASFTYNFSSEHQVQMYLTDPGSNAIVSDIDQFGLRAGHGTYTRTLAPQAGHQRLQLHVMVDTATTNSAVVTCSTDVVGVPPGDVDTADPRDPLVAPTPTVPVTQPTGEAATEAPPAGITATPANPGPIATQPPVTGGGATQPPGTGGGATSLPNTGSGSAHADGQAAWVSLLAGLALLLVLAGWTLRRQRRR